MLWAILSAAWLSLGPPPVQQPRPPGPPTLRWEAPVGCPDETQLRAQIDALAPGVLARVDPRRTAIAVDVARAGDAWGAAIVIEDVDGQRRRSLRGSECEVVGDAVALLVAVALDPVGVSVTLAGANVGGDEGSEGEQGASGGAGARSEGGQSEDDGAGFEAPGDGAGSEGGHSEGDGEESGRGGAEDGGARSERGDGDDEVGREDGPTGWGTRGRSLADGREDGPALRGAARIFGGGAWGPTDTGYGALGLSAALLGPRWRVELSGAWSPPREYRRSTALGGVFDGWQLGLRGCFAPAVGPRRRLELPLCGGIEAGQVRGRGIDELPVSLRADFPWIALSLGQALLFAPLERLAFGAELQLAAPLRGGRFMIEDVEIQRIVGLGARGLAIVELRLP
ncbi:hypothetical protein G6O69_20525 [Pseudenhygromyxa sp. WMMC2535]|uniref:hypothetical protein n=1 Tax=Pseudenhygromyxa sp. WMMC2535 TaxID=2712867 RepID=UPI001552D540|nr:hypothetical protein [Pseudenhygromyxa sp. WMMC2535]NVB40240.1 hypothetical protein [Pseudenhygromyxa sp. WMMC2535]